MTNCQYQLQQHFTILGWLLIIQHVILLLVAAFVFALLMGIALVTGDREATVILSIVATCVAALLALLMDLLSDSSRTSIAAPPA